MAVDNYILPLLLPRKRRLVVAQQMQIKNLLRELSMLSLNDVQIVCTLTMISQMMMRQLM